MHQPASIAITLSLPVTPGQELVHSIYSYCQSIYSYYRYYYRRTYCALFGNHTDHTS
ncbi:hypothetical protein JAO76_00655 [Pontibacter sp. BT310]|uniref:Uncharacterized protein n=1 Tax=Pontibacter populi TaxID=890055 RepID=A0ABS6X6N1_9BACT|nr:MULTISPECIES: hypothetical protein [Pontibacter]MBJ6116682.1 hypothetical protein [Pontibacter sp. BT310]MBR0569106.1 hypothetical protein [Microvirga sp. STS03]MBW3363536.1 hypothetical protein [Pontibacter populi]